jgi:hypothetical protein
MTKPTDRRGTDQPQDRDQGQGGGGDKPTLRLSHRLSEDDEANLLKLAPRLQLIRDRVRGVVTAHHTGFYLHGEGGTSKSFTVLEELKRLKANHVVHNSRMTGRGLVDTLQRLPTSTHVLEDCESMFDDKRAWGVLRSALWSQSKKKPMERQITWTAFETEIRFVFTGGIILIANRNLDRIPELNALGTRLASLQLLASFAEVAALMRKVALEGFDLGREYATPAECFEVAEFVIEQTRSLHLPLDMRMFVNGVRDFLQWKSGASATHWEGLIKTRLLKTTMVVESRQDRVDREAVIAQELAAMDLTRAERDRLWQERTGKNPRAYYRRLKQLRGQ